jgi:hypothetical protein
VRRREFTAEEDKGKKGKKEFRERGGGRERGETLFGFSASLCLCGEEPLNDALN